MLRLGLGAGVGPASGHSNVYASIVADVDLVAEGGRPTRALRVAGGGTLMVRSAAGLLGPLVFTNRRVELVQATQIVAAGSSPVGAVVA